MLATADVPVELLRRVRALLDEAFGGDFTKDDWQHALGGWHASVMVDGAVVSHAAVVQRVMDIGGRQFGSGYVVAVATAPNARRCGHGSRAMAELAEVIRRKFDIGLLSTSQHRFFEALGWERWRGPTFVVRDGEFVRTADEDDGIMALRFGPSAGVSLNKPIACRAREGDDR